MKHTPTPWTIQPLPHDYDFRKGNAFAIRDNRNCALAEVGHIDAIFDGDETEANAHLIAAAPDMYHALQTIIHGIERDCSDFSGKEYFSFHKDSPLADTLRKALAKAEGK